MEVDKHITQILTYLCQLDVSEYTEQYESLLNELLVIFSKLHRVQNFIAKLIQTFKGTKRRGTCTIEQILPNSVLVSFEKCIVPMASWQVINILKTFSFHLAHAVTEDVLNIEDGNTILYIEFLSDLLCSLLSCVRMAEHSISEMVLEKFFKNLEEIQGILGKFGKYLVNIEHVSFFVDIIYCNIYLIYFKEPEIDEKFLENSRYMGRSAHRTIVLLN